MKTSLGIALCVAGSMFEAIAITPTLTFQSAQPLMAGGIAIDLGSHAAPKLVDWNADGALDLLVAAGDGSIWLFRQSQSTNSTEFEPGTRITADGTHIRVGSGYAGACFADMNGDGLPDLVAAGNDERLRYYPNIGTASDPALGSFILVSGADGDFELPRHSAGRIEIADWDGDGKFDLLTGEFEGYITWYRNTGETNAPILGAPGIRFGREGSVIHEPYNTHPCVYDFNQDGIPDLAFGLNWGYFKVLINTQGHGATDFPADFLLRDATGGNLNIRALIADDTIPDFADLTGDGVLDLISGGLNGQLFVLPGISHTASMQNIERIMAAHPTDLGAELNGNSALRENLFGLHRGLRGLAGNLLPAADREFVRDWYRDHIARYPQYLTKRPLDPTIDAFVPSLAGQVWVNLFESMPDTHEHRMDTAMAAGFTGLHIDLLVDLGILYIENSRSTAASQRVLYDIATSIPPALQIVGTVTQNDFLKTGSGEHMSIQSRRGVNVFAQVGDYSEGFPSDVPQTRIDGFSVVVAHELNHNVEVAARSLYPWYDNRKHELLEQGAPPHLVFKDHENGPFGVDLPLTQANFLAHGYWDGVADHWNAAYNAYWNTGPGAGFDRHWLRDNLKYCIDAPQEAFATLANQYFTSSEVMLQLAIARWEQGITNGINQFLFFADVYALGSDETLFYRVDTAAELTRTSIPIQRDAFGHIRGLTLPTAQYEFQLDSEGNVQTLFANLKPLVASPMVDPPAITYGAEFSFQFPADTFLDPDADPLIYTASGMPAGINFDGETRTFFGASAETGDFLVTIMASDSRTPSLNAASEMTITIDPASLWVAAGALSKVYGASDPELSFTASGWQFDDTAESVLTGSLLREAGEKVSEWPYAITQGTLTATANYTVAFEGALFTIALAPLSITAENMTRQFGARDPALMAIFDGFVNDEKPEVLEGSLVLSREPGESVGDYLIIPSGLSSSNYSISFHTGILTIEATPAPMLLPPQHTGPDALTIAWTALPGVGYQVQYKSRWDEIWMDLSPEIRATESTASLPDQPIGATERFYRVVIP